MLSGALGVPTVMMGNRYGLVGPRHRHVAVVPDDPARVPRMPGEEWDAVLATAAAARVATVAARTGTTFDDREGN